MDEDQRSTPHESTKNEESQVIYIMIYCDQSQLRRTSRMRWFAYFTFPRATASARDSEEELRRIGLPAHDIDLSGLRRKYPNLKVCVACEENARK